ncbi:MAG: hypothetical protein COR54_16855, partial [Elusimicrobia bacterium CG22_combo_CG10-13_8_21_14_all_63_91]
KEGGQNRMKKLMGAVLASALMFPVGSANAAELLKNLKVSGNLDWQFNSARNVQDFSSAADDAISNAGMRTMLHGDWDVLDDVHANVTLRKNDTQWGSVASAGQGAGTSQSVTAAGGVLGNTYIDRANVTIDKLFGHLDTTVGRQWYGQPGDLIWYVGPRDEQTQDVQSIDAVRVKTENDWMMFDGVAGIMTGSTLGSGAGAAADAHTDIKGFNLWWKGLPVKVNTFVWNRVAHLAAAGNPGAVASANDNLYVYGVKLRGEAAGGWFNLDLAKNAGECRNATAASTRCGVSAGAEILSSNYTGHAALLELGFNGDVANVGGIAPWASFGWGSGQSDSQSGTQDMFYGIGSDWRPGVINRRFTLAGTAAGPDALGSIAPAAANTAVGTNGLSNRVVWGLGTNFTPAALDQLTAGVQLWDYRLQRNDTKNGQTPAAAAGNKHLGTELALTANWRHSENVSLSAGWARYFTGGFIKEQVAADSPATFVYSDISVKF